MKTLQSHFKKHSDDMFPDYGNLLKVTVGVFSSVLVIVAMHVLHIVF